MQRNSTITSSRNLMHRHLGDPPTAAADPGGGAAAARRLRALLRRQQPGQGRRRAVGMQLAKAARIRIHATSDNLC